MPSHVRPPSRSSAPSASVLVRLEVRVSYNWRHGKSWKGEARAQEQTESETRRGEGEGSREEARPSVLVVEETET